MRVSAGMLAGAVTLAASSLVSASTITTGLGWQLDSFQPFTGSGSAAFGPQAAVLVSPLNPGWTAQSIGMLAGVPWIGPTTDSATYGYYGLYTYSYTTVLAPGSYLLQGEYSSDNMVVSLKVNGAETVANPSAPVGGIYQFQHAVSLSEGTGSIVKIVATIYNEANWQGAGLPAPEYNGAELPNGVSDPSGNVNPTGFVLAANATSVPLPATLWGGLSLMGALGAAKIRRRSKLD